MQAPRLVRLSIDDFGLIAHAELTFADGFTACTGETGSGKTMLLGALAFALGERSSADVVRQGAARARATLELEPDEALRAQFAADGFELDEGELAIVAREIAPSGKSSARINGRPAGAAQLRALGDLLVDRIGQDEQQRLLTPAYQLDLLDRFAGPQALRRRAAVAERHAEVAALANEVRAASERAGRALAELEFARFALREMDEAAPQPGEDARLRERRDFLANAERIAAALSAAHGALAEGETAAVDALGAAAWALAGSARYGSELQALGERVAAVQSDAVDVAAGLAVRIPAKMIAELAAATPSQIRAVRLTPDGGTLEQRELHVDISVPGLLRDLLGFDAQSRGGKARSAAKVAAARANGAKGGRPKKVLA